MFFVNVLVLYSVQIEVIRGLAVLKKATAIVNKEYGLDAKLADVIVAASDEVHSADDVVFSNYCVILGFDNFSSNVSIAISSFFQHTELKIFFSFS